MPEPQEFTSYLRPQQEPKFWTILLVQLGLFVMGSGLGLLLYMSLCTLMGWDPQLSIGADASPAERWQVRLQFGLAHLFGFLGSALMVLRIFYPGKVQSYLQSEKQPGMINLGLGLLLMMVSLPLVMYSLNLNQLIPLPESMKAAESQAEEVLKGVLKMDNLAELMANLTLVAILPALGEEMVFRGVVQGQLMRRISNPMTAILLSAAIFSTAHFQFEGFIPRMMLGFFLGWLYWQTRNFWVPVACHFFNNGLQVLAQFFYARQMSTIDLEKDIQVPWPFALMSAFMVWAVMRLIWRQNRALE